MNPLHFKQRIPSRLLCHYRSRLRTTAKHPARRPPPRIVVPNETTAEVPAAGWVPSKRSRIPPCTMRTARVRTEPIANHQVNVLRGIRLTRTTMCRDSHLSATLTEGPRPVKKCRYCAIRRGVSAHLKRLAMVLPLSARDEEKLKLCHFHYRPSPILALRRLWWSPRMSPAQTAPPL